MALGRCAFMQPLVEARQFGFLHRLFSPRPALIGDLRHIKVPQKPESMPGESGKKLRKIRTALQKHRENKQKLGNNILDKSSRLP